MRDEMEDPAASSDSDGLPPDRQGDEIPWTDIYPDSRERGEGDTLEAIRVVDRAIADVLEIWRNFHDRMDAAGHPGARPLFDGRMTRAWKSVSRGERKRARTDFGWIVYSDAYTIPTMLRPD